MSALETVNWLPTRAAGLERLHAFVPSAGKQYSALRNFDYGPNDRANVSCLSPWVRHRLITEEEVLRATLDAHDLGTAQSFVQEVFWRSYFKGWLEHRPQVWASYQDDVELLDNRVQYDGTLQTDIEAACAGATGISCFDGWVQELLETGYLHNHARMWFASIWIFTLRLPWQLGADFFLRHLLDGDPASNTLSWRWVGGLHTVGKTYLATAENITRFTDGRFGAAEALSQQLATSAEPLRDDVDLDITPLPLTGPHRLEGRFGLLMTEDDMWGTPLTLTGEPAVAFANDVSMFRAVEETGPLVRQFVTGAFRDSLERVGAQFNFESEQTDITQSGDQLVCWARDNNLSFVVVAAPPVGHVAESTETDMRKLDAAGIELIRLHRDYDRVCWPHATAGFFKLKKNIPGILRELGLKSDASKIS